MPPKQLPESHRLRPRELFFIFLGATTGAGLGVLWFRLIPEALAHKGITRAALDGLAAALTHPALQIPILLVGFVTLAAGIATRTASGKDRATWILAAGSLLLFTSLAASAYVLYQPVLSPEPAAASEAVDDDWED